MDKNEILNSNCDVRRYAAGNPNTPADVLMKLAESGNSVVRKNAAGNPQHSRRCVERISKR